MVIVSKLNTRKNSQSVSTLNQTNNKHTHIYKQAEISFALGYSQEGGEKRMKIEEESLDFCKLWSSRAFYERLIKSHIEMSSDTHSSASSLNKRL